ncbi:DUF4383 domain-containing protein [Amycolatopsis acidicola]|uniref:DUF4383 domain-containing protein n=1 Tax=Amycolatopsis acidicola TaxID=2596893 RepID=A0A5N0UX62_9PSEU|nr:DUF4383 domain-containing protein [Amycolatopsis acidicola]KAA9153860.1 DUF4383 domain-containing protein [Amycolatopsis acidicola]
MARSEDTHIRVSGIQPVQVLAGLIGLVYLALGIVGFARTGFSDFAGNPEVMLLGFMINPLHNLVHVVVGVLGIVMASSSATSRIFGWLLFLGFGVVSIWGLMITGIISRNPVSGMGNPLNLNAADNWLHVVSAIVGLVLAVMPARKVAHISSPASTPADATTVSTPPAAAAQTQTMPPVDSTREPAMGADATPTEPSGTPKQHRMPRLGRRSAAH